MDLREIFTHICQGCFIGIGATIAASASEGTLKDLGKTDRPQTTKTQRSAKYVDNSNEARGDIVIVVIFMRTCLTALLLV